MFPNKRLHFVVILVLPLLLLGVISCGSIATPDSITPSANLKPIAIDHCHDGDTCRSTEGERIRFACIDAPELKQPYGEASRDHLRSLLKNREVKIERIAIDKYKRTIAILYIQVGSEWKPVQLLQVKAGTAWGFDRFKDNCPIWGMIEREAIAARSNRVGLFASGQAIEPWIWRKRNR